MNEIYRKVIEQQAAAVQAKSKKRRHDPDKPKYEYDSDEDVDGGTWEHKKRMLEMEKTKGTFIFASPIKWQFYPHIGTGKLICCASQLTGFYMRAILAFNGLSAGVSLCSFCSRVLVI